MSQFSIHRNINQNSKNIYPFLIDVQSNLLDDLDTRLVIPLIEKNSYENLRIKELNPIIDIKEIEYVALTQQMAAIRKYELGPIVENLKDYRQVILSSIDFLITGF